ncbi:MAG: ribonuclease H-like domain-containing protein [Deltaproteobacteria bacterium]|nr:ribonuclease H-like domain-containing protein [Deltaproteobacteria bacterium]MBW2145359.1 ribonuclease H-like domain-containing protein [Deltaproteobacteria bacterium]
MDRGDLNNVDGYFAVLLWYDFLQNTNQKALETLLAYNIEDTVNFETLMVLAYNIKLKGTPFFQAHQLTEPTHPNIPFEADRQTIDSIKRQIFREPSLYPNVNGKNLRTVCMI